MKILITGIHGFVGSNLVVYLKGEHQIYGLDIVFPNKEGIVRTYSWDDLDNKNLPEVDAIIHLAGKAHDTKKTSAAAVYFKINTELTEKLYNYFGESTAKKFIFFSTAKAAADRVEGILTEDVLPSPVGPYGESKIKAEQYILSHPFSGKETYILRPCMIHGPGNKGNLNLLYGVVSKGIPWPLGTFDNLRTLTTIENVCFTVNGLLTKEIESGIYNMGDDEPLSTNELIETICSVLGRKAHIWHIPKEIMILIARIGTIFHLPLNTERLRKLTENYVSSNAKIKKALGITEMPIRAKDGLIHTIESFKK